MRRVSVCVEGGDSDIVGWVADRLDPSQAELVPAGAAADVVVAAGDDRVTALDRCRRLGRDRPCIVLLPGVPSVADVTSAMTAGARAVLSVADDALAVGRGVAAAAAFVSRPDAGGPAPGRVVVVAGAHGGAGATTLAVAIAASLPARTAVIDLDLAGGGVADRLALAMEPTEPGLAGQSTGAGAWSALRVETGWCTVVPAPYRPELAWLVGEGVCAELVAAAAADADTVVVDVARATGPPIEVVPFADVVLVACRSSRSSVAAGVRQAGVLRRLAPTAAVHLCAIGARRRDAARLRLETVPGGARIAVVLPPLTDATRPCQRARRALAGLVGPA